MKHSILAQIKDLENMSIKKLKKKYHEVFGNSKGIQNNKPYLIKRIAYKIQENELGGLEQESKNEVNKLIAEANPLQKVKSKIKTNLIVNKKHRKIPLPGAILRKTYKGNLLEVKVLDAGFEYCGKIYKSLSKLAKEITGVHCSGFEFFKL